MEKKQYHIVYLYRDPDMGRPTRALLLPEELVNGFKFATGLRLETMYPVTEIRSPEDFPVPTRWVIKGQIANSRTAEDRRAREEADYQRRRKQVDYVCLEQPDNIIFKESVYYTESVKVNVDGSTRMEVLEKLSKLPKVTDEICAALMNEHYYELADGNFQAPVLRERGIDPTLHISLNIYTEYYNEANVGDGRLRARPFAGGAGIVVPD